MRLTAEREKEIDEYLSSFTGKNPLMNVTSALREQKEEIHALRQQNQALADDGELIRIERDEFREFREPLESIASLHKPNHDTEEYWLTVLHARCATVLATDTKIARNALKKAQHAMYVSEQRSESE